ncbi:helix-turn-helix transcriptional regulator [Marinobacterium lacunae]|nr:AlpA family transcriptional regulator [Marinobacterium lacunae]
MNKHVILTRKEVEKRTSFSRTSIYRLMDRGEFPRPIRLSANRVGWLESDLEQWLEQRTADSQPAA